MYFTQGKGIYRVVVNMGNKVRDEELKVIAGGTEGAFQAGSFDGLEAKTNDIHNRTCCKCFFGVFSLPARYVCFLPLYMQFNVVRSQFALTNQQSTKQLQASK